jgi:hypothetical protein
MTGDLAIKIGLTNALGLTGSTSLGCFPQIQKVLGWTFFAAGAMNVDESARSAAPARPSLPS